MPIENIFRCADEMDFAPQPTIEADFFSGGFDIPCEEQVSSSETEKPINPIKDWKFTINRAFMRGLTADDILNAIGDEIKIQENAEEILNYIKKYEGLIGTVFVDSSVLESGFPISAIPKKFTPYHRFAINCKNPKIIQNRSISGKSGGGIDDFLNSADRINVKTTEIDRILGLPILKNGMLTRNVIKEILEQLGSVGDTLRDLQKALKEKVLSVSVYIPTETEKADLQFGLKSGEVNIEIEDAPQTEKDIENYGLQDAGMTVSPDEATKTVSGIQLDYKASDKQDVSFETAPEQLEDVKIDENLRF